MGAHSDGLALKARNSGFWYASISLFSQLISWGFTMYVARMLSPEDYGLMTMAAFLTAYIEVLSDFGLGTAIVQKESVKERELSSIFWFALLSGVLLAFVCLLLAYPTSWIFREPRLIPVTCLIAPLFILGTSVTVPYSLLRRAFKFKEIGFIKLAAMLVTGSSQVVMAKLGFGVYTLILGNILFKFITISLVFVVAGWRPAYYFKLRDIRPYLHFGINIACSQAVFRLFESIDKFIVGKLFSAQLLGIYGFGLNLANFPLNKIWPIFHQILFPLLSRYQDDSERLNQSYLNTLKYYILLVAPLFIGGAMFGNEIITVILGEKWVAVIPFFRCFCIAKLVEAFSAFNNLYLYSQGRPNWVLKYNVVNAIVMLAAIYACALQGFDSLIIPWLYLSPATGICWIVISKVKLGFPMYDYVKVVLFSLSPNVLIAVLLKWSTCLLEEFHMALDIKLIFAYEIVAGGTLYVAYLFVFNKKALYFLESRKS